MKDCSKGFTIMELLIAIAIFSIGILAVASLHISAIGHNTSSRIYTEAASFGAGQIEELINLPYDHDDLAVGIHSTVRDIYTIEWQVTGQVTDNDLSDSNDIDMVKEILVTVTNEKSPDRTFQATYYKAKGF